MFHFLDTAPFLRIELRVAMATMHFHIAQTGFFWGRGTFLFIQGIPGNNLATMKNCPGVQGRSNYIPEFG